MAARTGSGTSLNDVYRPFQKAQLVKGWENQREYSYWIPEADIEGEIPADLSGTFLRNGPGLNDVYGTSLKHPIDGDGMVCAITILNGRVHFRNKFVRSQHREEEEEQKQFIYRGQMGTKVSSTIADTARAVTCLVSGQVPKIIFRNPSNTNVLYWGGKILSVYETHLPHCLDPYTLETMGLDNLGGVLNDLKAFAAHFRVDSVNQRLVCISIRPGLRLPARVGIYEWEKDWTLHKKTILPIPGLNYSHDFVLLPDYYLFHMTPFVKISWGMAFKIAAGWTSPGESMKYYPELPSKFVLVPRHTSNPGKGIIMVDTDPTHIFHFGTAQQVGDNVEFVAPSLGKNFDMSVDTTTGWLSNAQVAPGIMYKYTIDLKARTCQRKKVDRASVEFPFSHPFRHGVRGTRYSFCMASDRAEATTPYRDIVKFDAEGEDRQVWYSNGVIGEPLFAPKGGWKSVYEGEEDDGYVLVQLYIPEKHLTEYCILDAKQIHKGPLARIKLKHHVPYGFHGSYTPEVFVGQPFIQSKL